MATSRDEAREHLLRKISPDWTCPACEHDKFFVTDSFVVLPTRESFEASVPNGAFTSIGIVCLSCGYLSQHLVKVLNGELAAKWAEEE